jgi:hypothetical protein
VDRLFAISRVWAGISALLLLSAATAQAQQPSQAQRDALRQSCRSDFIANCSGVTPGGKDALDCLKRNLTKLSSACQAAVSALSPPAAAPPSAVVPPAAAPAPSAAPPTAQPAPSPPAAQAKPSAPTAPASPPTQPPASPPASAAAPVSPNVLVLPPREALRIVRICQYDQRTLCPDVPLGGGRVIACLMQNMPALSRRCRDALTPAAH